MNKQDIINDAIKVYKKSNKLNLNSYIKYGGLYSKKDIEKYFFSFSNFLEEVQKNFIDNIKISKSDVDKDIIDIFQKYGKITTKMYKKYGKFSLRDIYNFYDSFDDLKKELNINIKGNVTIFSKEEIINMAIHDFNKDKFIRSREFLNNNNINVHNFKKFFNNFKELTDEIGITDELKKIRYSYDKKFKRNVIIGHSKEEIYNICHSLYIENNFLNLTLIKNNTNISRQEINEYFGNITNLKNEIINKNLKNFLDKTIKEIIFKNNSINHELLKDNNISLSVINKVYGSYENMCALYNIKYNNNKAISKKDVIKDLEELYKKYKNLSMPILDKHGKYEYHVYYNKVGNTNEIYKELGILNTKSCRNRSDICDYILYRIELILGCKCEYEKSFDECYNPKTNKKLKFDGYFKEFNLLVEYDGIQHYEMNNYFHKTEEQFKSSLIKDKIRNEFCENNNINLLRIRYDDKVDTDEDLIILLKKVLKKW